MLRMMKTITCVARKRGRMWTACASGLNQDRRLRDRTAHIGKNYVGERVLSEKRSLLDVDQDAAEERDQHAHPVRLAQCPEERVCVDKIRHPGRAVQHEVEQDAHQNGGADPERIRRLQDVLPGCVAMVDGEEDGKSVSRDSRFVLLRRVALRSVGFRRVTRVRILHETDHHVPSDRRYRRSA